MKGDGLRLIKSSEKGIFIDPWGGCGSFQSAYPEAAVKGKNTGGAAPSRHLPGSRELWCRPSTSFSSQPRPGGFRGPETSEARKLPGLISSETVCGATLGRERRRQDPGMR